MNPDWAGMAVIAATLLVPGLTAWALLALGDRRKAARDAREAARRRHPSSRFRLGERQRRERMSRAERQGFEPQFRRIARALEAEMAETDGKR